MAKKRTSRTVERKVDLKLGKNTWNRFVAILDAPPRKIPALRELLTGSSIFDENKGSRRA